LQVEVRVSVHQRIEDELVNAFGLSIDSNPGIEIGGAVLNQHGDGLGIGFVAAAASGYGQKQEQSENGAVR
jgi:hypothetical protein